MEQTLTYESAFKELQDIAQEIERDSVPIDVLAQKVKRASELINHCQTKLRVTEDEVTRIINQMDKKS